MFRITRPSVGNDPPPPLLVKKERKGCMDPGLIVKVPGVPQHCYSQESFLFSLSWTAVVGTDHLLVSLCLALFFCVQKKGKQKKKGAWLSSMYFDCT